jgi:regulator of protease activity HflC (stomatin/prohibitin superfamily)
MNEIRPETHAPKHHSYRAKPAILILIGLVVGGAIYFGVMAWYFTGVDPGGGPSGFGGDVAKSSPAAEGQGNLALPSFSTKLFSEVQVMWIQYTAIGLGVALVLVVLYLASCIRILNEYQRGVIFRLGRAMPTPKGPGLIMVFSPVDTMTRVDLRTIARVIEPQDIITRDNVSVRVNAVLYFRVVDPMRSVLEVADFLFATSQVALTTLRSTLGQAELDDLLTERDKVNHRLQEIIDGHTEPWGVKVSVVEVKDVDLPEPMKRSMAHQAEAERDRRAKVINAEGEFQAADKLRQAAQIMTPYPMAMQMRYLQALAEVASEKNSTIIFPLPLELLAPFLKSGRDGASNAALTSGRAEDASLAVKESVQSEQATGSRAIPTTVGGNGR